MKFIFDNWMLISVALASGALLFWPVLQGAVCEPDEFAAGHVGGSKNVPLGDLEKKLAAAVKNKNVPLILVCQTGARSTSAALIAKKLGYEQAQSLAGGLVAWKAANLPVEKG